MPTRYKKNPSVRAQRGLVLSAFCEGIPPRVCSGRTLDRPTAGAPHAVSACGVLGATTEHVILLALTTEGRSAFRDEGSSRAARESQPTRLVSQHCAALFVGAQHAAPHVRIELPTTHRSFRAKREIPLRSFHVPPSSSLVILRSAFCDEGPQLTRLGTLPNHETRLSFRAKREIPLRCKPALRSRQKLSQHHVR
jgi:hypothetical protein